MKKLKLWLTLGIILSFLVISGASYAYQALEVDGNGYASIVDASQAGLNMGLSDFMVEGWIKASTTGTGNQRIVSKDSTQLYFMRLNGSDGYLLAHISDGSNTSTATGISDLRDGKRHYIVLIVDRSSSTGMQLYLDGSTHGSAANPTSVGTLDNGDDFHVGVRTGVLDNPFYGQIDELRIWNFGKDGLPADYATYITWRATARNIFLDISEYDSGAWNGYADADRTEMVTDGGLENWTGDTSDDWTEQFESAGIRDITDETVQVHGGSHASKHECTNNDGTSINILQLGKTLAANKYYEMSAWVYFPTRTAGDIQVMAWNATDGIWASATLASTNAAYEQLAVVGAPTVAAGNAPNLKFLNETTTGIVYFDDASLKRVGLVAHYKFNGDYTDETSNSNTLTAGGSGNAFPGYTLKKQKIISPAWIR